LTLSSVGVSRSWIIWAKIGQTAVVKLPDLLEKRSAA